ncbi:MAG TPA: serine hydrolase domain-containing protein, partial [bacterium]|nr:serine hydrolase domain-containing protein [bacterium]
MRNPGISTAVGLTLAIFFAYPALGQTPTGIATTATPASTPVPTFTPNPAGADYSRTIEDLEKFIPEQMDKHHVQGLSLALVDGDRIVWMKGFGYASLHTHADADTLYHLGAVSKIFTAAEVLTLAQKGKIGLDRPIQTYVPGFSIRSRFKHAKPITARALLANHSGLPGFYLKGIWVDQPESLADAVKDLKDDYLVAPPQTLYKYSYVDYTVLGRMVELKRNEEFAQAVKEDVFEPLGMDSSSFDNSSDTDPRLAQGYRHGDPVTLIHLRDTPAAGMVSSARDLAKFLQVILGDGGSPRPHWADAMFTPAYPDIPLDFGHKVGLGWQLSGINIPGAEGVAWHDGEFPPYNAQVVALNRQGLGLVLLSNCAEGDALQGDVTVRALKLMLQAKYGIPEDLKKKEIKMPPTVDVVPEVLDKDTGYYSALGQLMKITRQDGRLEAEWDGHNLDLLPIAQDRFVPHITFIIFPIDLPQFPLTFMRINNKPMATLGGFTFPIPLEGIEPVEIPAAWKAREGDYELENPDGVFNFSRISLGEKDGFLTVDMKVSFPAFDIKDREFKIALLPLSDEEALIPGLFYGDG